MLRFAYADPPYLGCGKLYADKHDEALIWDDPQAHRDLVDQLCGDFSDGWALSLHEPSLRTILNFCPDDVRVTSWVKPFASFKPNVRRAYTWEPVIFRGGRKLTRQKPTWRDHICEPITMKKGLTGAKPPKFCHWVLDGLGFEPGDIVEDLFPGTGIMGEVVASRSGAPIQEGCSVMCKAHPKAVSAQVIKRLLKRGLGVEDMAAKHGFDPDDVRREIRALRESGELSEIYERGRG